MKFNYLLLFLTFVLVTAAHVIPGVPQLSAQALFKRDTDLMDTVFDALPRDQYHYILEKLHDLQVAKGNLSNCTQCKTRLRFAQDLINKEPEHAHLTALMLYKDCTITPYTKDDCTLKEFFVATQYNDQPKFNNDYDAGIASQYVVNFYDNDFLHFIRLLNVSNDVELDYYCYYKGGACDLPDVESIVDSFEVDNWWPEKQPEHYHEPVYSNSNRSRFNVLHLSDLHVQIRYEVGTESLCNQMSCGFPESFNKTLIPPHYNFTDYYAQENPNLAVDDFKFSFYPDAHYEGVEYIKGDYYDYPKYKGWSYSYLPATVFGGYLTDSPETLLNNSLIQMGKMHQDLNFEFAVFTADLVDHQTYQCTPEFTKEEETRGFKIIKEYLGDIPVLPSLGNHDATPYLLLAPLQLDYNNTYSWNVDEMVDLWIGNGWFNESRSQELKDHYSGFAYTTDRGLKVIALNSNTYYSSNTWGYLNATIEPDLFGQWEFLVSELLDSESKGQRVWIMAHVPPNGADAAAIPSRIFQKIVQRFAPYTIANIFYGHTHVDEFIVAYSPETNATGKEPIVGAWVVQSVTPWRHYNPSFRYYEVEDESFNVFESFNYYTLLNETFINDGAEPEWLFEYSARDVYDPDQQWPKDAPLNATFWNDVVIPKLNDTSNIEYNQMYANYYYRFSPYTTNCTDPSGQNVSATCYNNIYCYVTNLDALERAKCLI
ncbi:Sphingomyelin phosphodiesterase 2 [Candida viswanathii]|uniref:Sphingomyelin phosphodiesterase 2 n=1 Tax=Candida viswanathii TaxID=5486 RepID=A0A367Y147_9ASCO|nr:Sphingomyelin phosphodiesterase 2 [Candida viswanathii]